MASWARGFGIVDGAVCSGCVSDDGIIDFISKNATEHACDFCGQSGAGPVAVDADSVVDLVSRSIKAEYNLVEDELLFDEGDYQGTYYETGELLEWELDHPLGDGLFAEAVKRAAREQYWCRRDYHFGGPDEHLISSWRDFADSVKYESRYLFIWGPIDRESDEEWVSGERRLRGRVLLRETGRLIDRLGLVRTLPEGTDLMRVRRPRHGSRCSTARQLGSPSKDKATSSRMSPAGIPLFYGAFDEETALAETHRNSEDRDTVLATFCTSRDCRVVDLAQLPNMPSLFDDERRQDRWPLRFLYAFRKQIIVPIVPDDRVHIDYVPTQIVTEYLRLWFPADGEDVDGVIFPSSRRQGGLCVAMFVDSEGCLEKDEVSHDSGRLYLRLNAYESR